MLPVRADTNFFSIKLYSHVWHIAVHGYIFIFMEHTQQPPIQQGPIQRPLPPKNWLTESILATIFCCLPFGIVGIVHASKVDSLYYMGQIEAAQRASKDAERWTKIAFWVGIGIATLYFLFYVVYFVIIIGIFAASAGAH